MSYEIDKNVPVPEKGRKKKKYPFGAMAVGDSFLVTTAGDCANVRSAASYYKIRHPGFAFSVQKEGEGMRIWRIEA